MKCIIFVLSFLISFGFPKMLKYQASDTAFGESEDIKPKITIRKNCEPNIEIKKNETLVLQFSEYPGRGYSWLLMTPDTSLVNMKLERVSRSTPSNRLDPEQKVEFYFLAVKKGEEVLKFKYFRPWEKNKPGADSCITKIKINE